MNSDHGADGAARRANEGVEHLQAAALEMLAAARSFLDVVEDVVSDRDKMSAVAGVVADAVETIGRSVSSMAAERGGATTDPVGSSPEDATRVRRVVVE